MEGLILLVVAAIFLAIGVPIGISLAVAMIAVIQVNPVTGIQFLAQQMFSGLDSFPLLAIPTFMLAGAIMETGGLSKRLVTAAMGLVGHMTGGLGMVTVVACLFFGAISGSSPATVAAIGGIMIPHMVADKYDRLYATALVAIAGGLGVIIPPSIPFVVYGVTSTESVGTMFTAGFLPGILIGIFLMVVNYFRAKKRGYAGKGKFTINNLLKCLWEAKWALLMPIIILGGIYGGIFSPTEAAVVAILYGILIGKWVYKELTWKNLVKIFDNNTSFVGAIMMTFAPAGALGAVFSLLHIPEAVVNALTSVTDSKIVVLLLINLLLIVVGMIIGTIEAIVIMTPILLPAVKAYGVNPIHFGIILVVNLAIGFVTPPVAGNLFVASAMTKIPMEKIAKMAIPSIIAMFLALIVITYVPMVALFLPKLFGQMPW